MNARHQNLSPDNHCPPAYCFGRGAVGVAGHRAMGLVELLLSIVVLTLVMGVLVLISESLQADTSDTQTRATLRSLRVALREYRLRHNAWPEASNTATVMKTLLDDEHTAPLVRPLQLHTDPRDLVRVHDGYGQPIRYRVRGEGETSTADFVSAGPDGRFGDLTSPDSAVRQDAIDNLYGADLETPTP